MISSTNKIRQKPVFKKVQVDDTDKVQPLPIPPGIYPYQLNIEKILLSTSKQRMVFNMVGDTGSIRLPKFQQRVAGEMIRQIREAAHPQDRSLFLYHLGDIVYKFGEAEGYHEQFFEPYRNFPRPIFAIPGNHDSDVNPESAQPYCSLDAFVSVFCDTEARQIKLAEETGRKSMTEPNVYWTLQTPLANIIGLYTNVPKYGYVTNEQKEWFITQLQAAAAERPSKACIVCLHHAPYSADINHGSSHAMIEFLEAAFDKAGVLPDIVFSGHVHNYQRFSKRYSTNAVVPYIVAGAGGYDELHPIADLKDDDYADNSELFDTVSLDKYCDHKHGFLKIIIDKKTDGLTLTGEYYAIPHQENNDELPAVLFDSFTINIG